MAEDTTLNVDINAKATGEADTKALADAVASVGDALRNLATDTKAAVKVIDKIEQSIVSGGKSAKTAAAGYKELGASVKNITATGAGLSDDAKEASLYARAHAEELKKVYNLTSQGATAYAREKAAIIEGNALLNQRLKTIQQTATASTSVRLTAPTASVASTGQPAGSVKTAAFQNYGPQISASQRLAAQNTATLQKMNATLQQSIQNLGNYQDRLANTRYALYAFANGLGLAGAALLATNVGIVKIAADFETAFANIERTSGLSGTALAKLDAQFVELGQTIPSSFSDLGNIATLAGQLNIPAQSIASFTKTVAQFTATTNVSTDQAAEAFGRLDSLLPDVQGNYEALGSSILNVGVNSVATESEIISTTSQIAAAGAQAQFTADQVIGLAASYASLGVAPEAARGTTIRVFSEIRSAVVEGGESLETFAKLAGMSISEFKNAEPAQRFISILKGLDSEGENAEATIKGLGITAVRDINALLRLSQNVDLVGDNLGYAADGFKDASQLGDSFAIIAQTVAAKAQELLNSFQALFGTLGGSGLAIIGEVIDGLKEMIIFFTALANNPLVQSLATVIGAVTALSGIILIAGSGVGRLVATLLAGRPVMDLFGQASSIAAQRIAIVQRSAAAAGIQMGTLRAATVAAGTALKTAFATTGAGLAVVAGLTLAVSAFTALNDAMKSNSEVAKEAFGSLDDLGKTLIPVNEAAEQGIKVYGTVAGTITTTKEATESWTGAISNAKTGQIELTDASTAAENSIRTQTFAITEQTLALLANKLAQDASIQSFIKAAQYYNNAEGVQGKQKFDYQGVLTKAAQGDSAGARKIVDDYVAYAKEQGLGTAFLSSGAYGKAKQAIDLTTGALEGATAQTEIATVVTDALGVKTAATGEALGDEADAASLAADAMTQLSNAVSAAFANTNAISAFNQDFATLVQSIYDGGNSFSAFDQAGQANLANLQSTIVSSIQAGAALGLNASESVALVFRQLQQSGVDTAKLLSSLAGIPGVKVGDVSGYLGGTKAMTLQGQALAASLDQTASSARAAAAQTKSVGSAAKEAAPEIRTLKDYASDLGGVFSRAFEIRFGGTQAFDAITSGWQEIAKATEDANAKIREAQITLQQLSSDKSIQEYFLSIANQYGDSLRAADISAELAEINGKIADESANVAAAQASASKELDGNSAAAIANRATIAGLVTNYQGYIESLASSGLSTEELAAKTAELKQDFIQQATQMGFNIDQVNVYSAAFDDMSAAISAVPRNITVSANANPAQQAINEFLANNRNGNGLSSLSGGVNIPITSTFDDSAAQKAARAVALTAQMNGYLRASALSQRNDPASAKRLEDAANSIANQLASGNYKSGGYTGNGGTSQIAGQVHGKEFVVDAPNTARLGLPFLNALNNGAMPTSAQNSAQVGARSGVQLVELAASDKGLLMAIASALNLSIDGKVIAQAANNATLVAARKGSA